MQSITQPVMSTKKLNSGKAYTENAQEREDNISPIQKHMCNSNCYTLGLLTSVTVFFSQASRRKNSKYFS